MNFDDALKYYEGPVYPVKLPILGITGKKGHGKDAVAGILQNQHGWARCAFADELKKIAQHLWELDDLQVHGSIRDKETVDPRWGKSPRQLLQTLGTEAGRGSHPETWIRVLLRRLVETEEALVEMGATPRVGWAVCDVRFPNEASAIRRHGGIVWRVNRESFGTGDFESHSSETSIDLITPDRVIKNDGTLEDLGAEVGRAYDELLLGRARSLGLQAQGSRLCSGKMR